MKQDKQKVIGHESRACVNWCTESNVVAPKTKHCFIWTFLKPQILFACLSPLYVYTGFFFFGLKQSERCTSGLCCCISALFSSSQCWLCNRALIFPPVKSIKKSGLKKPSKAPTICPTILTQFCLWGFFKMYVQFFRLLIHELYSFTLLCYSVFTSI